MSILLLPKQKNSKKQGDVGLAIAIAWLAEAGYNIAIPLTDSQDYDLVIEQNMVFSGVQVRTTYFKNPQGNYRANLRVMGGNRSGVGTVKKFDPSRVHFLFIVTESREKYFIPCRELMLVNSITLSEKYSQYRVE
jgi:hypothetical protein